MVVYAHKFDRGAAAISWARQWLNTHPGSGTFEVAPDGNDANDALLSTELEAARLTGVSALWSLGQSDHPEVKAYLKSRGIEWDQLPAEDQAGLRYLANQRGAEGALLVAMRDEDGNILATQRTFIMDGRKTSIQPARKTMRGTRDWSSRASATYAERSPSSKALKMPCHSVSLAPSARSPSQVLPI